MGLGDVHLGSTDISQTTQSIGSSATSLFNNGLSSAVVSSYDLPWEKSKIDSAFFHYIKIEPSRWDELHPYRLMVIDCRNNGLVTENDGVLQDNFSGGSVIIGTGNAIVEFLPPSPIWSMRLPISPQQLSIQDQFAIQTTPTLRGILEEHSGVRFKLINAQGTMGVWPQRASITHPPGTPTILQSLFGGTIEAASNLVSSVTSLVNIASGKHPANKPKSIRPGDTDQGETSTGYYQALKLQQFLEQYAEAKKDPKRAHWRLVFNIPKQNQSFVVTPVVYNWQQNANKPMEIMYNFQLKAWRRIEINLPADELQADNQPISPGILQGILGTINQARQVMGASLNLIGAVRSDVETPLNVLRQLTLFVKDLSGVAITAIDLPNQLIKDYKSSISTSLNILQDSIKNFTSDPTTIAALGSVVAASTLFEGLSQSAVINGQLGSNASASLSLNPVNAVFAQPDAYHTLLDQVPVSSLSLTNAQQNQVKQLIVAARETTVDTLKGYRAIILQLSTQLSNSFGAGSAYYDMIYNQPPPTPRLQPMTLDEYDILKSLYDVIASCDILTATTQVDDNNIETTMQYVAGLADTAGIAFTIPGSKVLAPVPFGLTIEGISARYLKDPQRWIEIATLNGLRDPYIDETGFQLPLLSNAIGRQITVGSNNNLYIGQRVIVNSLTQIMSSRTILAIDRLSDTSFLLTLDGLANLDNFILQDKAYIQVYLPGTVNSQQKIFIPSDLPIPDESSIIPPAGTSSDPLTGLSRVDWLLQDNGDLAVNNYGDFRYSYGITNIIQALRIKFGTQAGKVLLHPNFGLTIKPGTISSEIQIQDVYNSINQMIRQDPRFSGIQKLQVSLNGTTLGISLAVTIPGQTGVFPVTFALTP